MSEIILKKRYPHSRSEDITDAFMRGYVKGKADIPTWIPCSERLPSNFGKDETVLATTDVDGRRVVLMLATDVERFYLKGYVSAWMPSPKPWEGADDDNNNEHE